MNVGCWKRQCCSRQPHDCIRILVRQFCPYLAYIWQISRADTRHFAYIYMALVLVGKAISGVKYTL